MHKSFAAEAANAVALHLFTVKAFAALKSEPVPGARALAKAQGFSGAAGQVLIVPAADGSLGAVLGGLGHGEDALCVAALSAKLPEATYKVETQSGLAFAHIAAGWADGAYRFDRYLKEKSKLPPRLVIPQTENAAALTREAAAIDHLRDMVNAPANDMTPQALQAEVSELAERFGARVTSIAGPALLSSNYPMVHAVGRAAAHLPCFIELEWGDPKHPKLALVGKGVTFDSGGLDIKPSDGMRIMKKDMGGAAHAIALAELIMSAGLKVHLKLYVPAVENAISGNAFRPGDIIPTRKGLTVEIDNTDAEGRLILCDAITRACEDAPDLLIDFATLTGAARVALGPDLAPLYTNDDALAAEIEAAARASGDPVWRMPLWEPYNADFKSSVADLANSGGKFAGSITAALFLQHFVTTPHWAHFDIWAWRRAKYGRSEGGAACGLRAVWTMLQKRYG